MRWKQFFTPVKSLDAIAAEQYLQDTPIVERTLVDVRQPGEYAAGHIPGAQLIPLPDLGSRVGEIEKEKDVLVYCAVGGRSRVAAQMLAGQGFASVINLTGGFRAWQGKQALFDEARGLELFTGRETAAHALEVAYALEGGLRDFYLARAAATQDPDAALLFDKLAAIEVRHQDRIFAQYQQAVSPGMEPREVFEARIERGVVEGGLTTEEFEELYPASGRGAADVVDMAMTIEAQAMDLYSRAAVQAESDATRGFLEQMAREEQTHLRLLGDLLDKLVAGGL